MARQVLFLTLSLWLGSFGRCVLFLTNDNWGGMQGYRVILLLNSLGGKIQLSTQVTISGVETVHD